MTSGPYSSLPYWVPEAKLPMEEHLYMDWRREDYGYATAAVAAVAFLVYLVVGNFGLVPSPLAPARASAGPPAGIAPLAAPASGSLGSLVPGVAPLPPPTISRPVPVLPSDMVPPEVAITTENGASIALGQPAVVGGVVTDASSNIEEVVVTFTQPSGRSSMTTADISCDEKNQCSWTAEIPAVVAAYSVTAQATDAAGNVGHSGTVDIAVLNAGNTVEQVGNVVRNVPDLLENVVQQLLGLLG
jgi:hypothetical protein